jgi:predicted amidohydrolase
VVVGTTVFGSAAPYPGLAVRCDELAALVEEMAARAEEAWPGHGLDLAVLPEAVLTPNADQAADRSIRLDDPAVDRFRALARRHETYLVLALDLAEDGPAGPSYANAVAVLDRQGEVAGIYRKAHPVSVVGCPDDEGGVTPGADFPVFACDFGTLGVQICWDVVYDDGWAALADAGAELVAFPSASPATIRTAAHAARHRYFVVSSTPRDNAAVYEPTGLVAARVHDHGAVLVHRLDLSHAVLGWSPALREGEALRERFGDRVGFHYSRREDIGLFWSDDDTTTVETMIATVGAEEIDAQIERNLRLKGARQAM